MNYLNLPIEGYFGKGVTRGENELLSLRLIHPDISRREPDLYQTKWWDYRVMHPVETTRYWASCYARAVRDFAHRAHDHTRAAAARAFSHEDVMQTREATGAINARQHMDRIGCRYPWALSWLTNRFIEHGWRGFPRPNQLYGDELVLDLADAWALELKASLQMPRADAFRRPSELRTAYTDWAIAQARARSARGLLWMPVSTLLAADVVCPDRVRELVGDDILARALSVGAKT